MPHGELLIKTHKAVTGRDANGYVDAFDRYGLSLEKMSPLLMEPGNKEPVGNSNALTNGVSYLGSTIGVKDENHISSEVHLYAANESQFLTRYELFCDEVLRLDRGEFIRLKTNRHPNRVYRVFHQNFQQFSTFNMEMAKFMWVITFSRLLSLWRSKSPQLNKSSLEVIYQQLPNLIQVSFKAI